MKKIDELVPGLKFRAAGGLVWEIDRIEELSTPIPHVRMVGVGDPTSVKVIAQSVLMDQARFQAV